MDALLTQAQDFLTKQGLPFALDLLGAALIVIVGFWLAGRVGRLTEKAFARTKKIDVMVRQFFAGVAKYLVLAFTIIIVLDQFGIQTTSLVALLGAAGLAVGLALQGMLSNLAAGVMILLFRPFKVGDYVEAGGNAGTVHQVGLFATEMNTPDNVRVTVPNNQIWGVAITNYSVNATRRLDIPCGIGYGEPIPKALDTLMGCAKADQRVLDDPAPETFVAALGASSVDVTLRIWCKAEDYWALKWALTRAVKEAFDREGIEIPFPQRVVHTVGAPSETGEQGSEAA